MRPTFPAYQTELFFDSMIAENKIKVYQNYYKIENKKFPSNA